MAALGLLQGFGRGLSQGAGMMQQAMAEDREVERQRMREESIARRWVKQEQREDARYKSEQEYRQGRDKAMDDRMSRQESAQAAAAKQAQTNADRFFNLQERQLSAQEETRRAQRIEETLDRIQSKFSREGEQIDRRYERLIDKAEPEDKAALYEQRDREHEALSAKLNGEMLPALKSFGDGLKGTSYASYLDVLAEMDKPKQDAQPAQSEATVPAGFNRNSAVHGALGEPGVQQTPAIENTAPGSLSPGLLGGFAYGSGGFYKNQMAKPNWDAMSPAEKATTFVAGGAGAVPGLLRDAVEIGKDYVFDPVAQWSTARPTNQGRK